MTDIFAHARVCKDSYSNSWKAPLPSGATQPAATFQDTEALPLGVRRILHIVWKSLTTAILRKSFELSQAIRYG